MLVTCKGRVLSCEGENCTVVADYANDIVWVMVDDVCVEMTVERLEELLCVMATHKHYAEALSR